MHIPQPDDLNTRDREHYEVARALPGWFTGGAFRDCYRRRYPDRNPGSIIPSDYCVNRHNKGNATYPRFLEWDNATRYRFIDLRRSKSAETDSPAASPPQTRPAAVEDQPVRRRSRRRHVFAPGTGRSLLLAADFAERAIRGYNGDPEVLNQEDRAFLVLGSGLSGNCVLDQLRVLDKEYHTRSVKDDIVKIANTIEAQWTQWEALVHGLAPLAEAVPPSDVTAALMRFFLSCGTRRSPRSLATKALHFAQPLTFIPADGYAVDC